MTGSLHRRLRLRLLVSVAIASMVGSCGVRAQEGISKSDPSRHPWEIGALVQGGKGVTDNRNDFTFMMAGVHAGKVLTGDFGPKLLRGDFEYAAELFPFWQSYTPRFDRYACRLASTGTGPGSNVVCFGPYRTGGTYTGVSLTPIILRWNFAGTARVTPWVQGAGGLLWTNHKYPAFGTTVPSLENDGPDANTSVWNFTPQFGIGLHYFVSQRRSVDLGANAVHISSASLGDRNPGVNASVQFNLGYTWWR